MFWFFLVLLLFVHLVAWGTRVFFVGACIYLFWGKTFAHTIYLLFYFFVAAIHCQLLFVITLWLAVSDTCAL